MSKRNGKKNFDNSQHFYYDQPTNKKTKFDPDELLEFPQEDAPKNLNGKLKNVFELLQSEKAKQARETFEKVAETDSVEHCLIKGKLEQKYQNWGEAVNAFSGVLEIEPQQDEALG